MPETGRLKIIAERGGTIGEITAFLADLEAAYVALYMFEERVAQYRRLHRLFPIELVFPFPSSAPYQGPPLTAESIPPTFRLTVERVQIESPGFWEVMASMNPLQQIREFLNDRHKRRQDREWREAAEKEKLAHENEVLRNTVIQGRVTILRDLGFGNEEIGAYVWSEIGPPMSRLGRHQDNRLIGGAE